MYVYRNGKLTADKKGDQTKIFVYDIFMPSISRKGISGLSTTRRLTIMQVTAHGGAKDKCSNPDPHDLADNADSPGRRHGSVINNTIFYFALSFTLSHVYLTWLGIHLWIGMLTFENYTRKKYFF